jgi:hypothetical protein
MWGKPGWGARSMSDGGTRGRLQQMQPLLRKPRAGPS